MKLTAHILLFYFCIGAMFPKGDFSQLLKLNDLLEHYDLHKKEAAALGETMSVHEFLYLHFVVGDDHHDSENPHENLPFHHFNSSNFQIAQAHFELEETPVIIAKNQVNNYLEFDGEEFTTSIFHPPLTV